MMKRRQKKNLKDNDVEKLRNHLCFFSRLSLSVSLSHAHTRTLSLLHSFFLNIQT